MLLRKPASRKRFLLSYKPLWVIKPYKKGHYSWEQRGRMKSLSPMPSLVGSEILTRISWSKQTCPVCSCHLKRWGVNKSVMDCSLSLLQHCMYCCFIFCITNSYFWELSSFSSESCRKLVSSKRGVDHLNNVVISCLSLLLARET